MVFCYGSPSRLRHRFMKILVCMLSLSNFCINVILASENSLVSVSSSSIFSKILYSVGIILLWTYNRIVQWNNLGLKKKNFFFFFFLALRHGLWDLSSPTRDWTQPWQWKSWVLTSRLPGNSWKFLRGNF